MPLKLNSTGGGSVTLDVPSTGSALTVTVPALTGTIITTGDTGTITETMLAANSVGTNEIIASAVTPAKLSQPMTKMTANSAISGSTFVDFTGIPSWVRRITVMFNNVSTNGASLVHIRLGSGSISTTGYKSTASWGGSAANQYAGSTSGFVVDSTYVSASYTRSGSYMFTHITSNTWVGHGNIGGDQTALVTYACAGVSPDLPGALDRVRITTVNGTDTFDAGTINVMYE